MKKIRPGITTDPEVWEEFKRKVGAKNSSEVLEEFMRKYSSSNNKNDAQLVVLIDADVLSEFEKKHKKEDVPISKKIEELIEMESQMSSPPTIFNGEKVKNFNFHNAEQWSTTFSNNSLQIQNLSYNSSDAYTNTNFTNSEIIIK